MWTVKCWRVPVLLAALLHGVWAAHAAPPAARAGGDRTVTNEAGQPIVVNGERINYRREELRQAPARKPHSQAAGAALTAPPAGQLASWSWATLGVNIGVGGMVTAQVGDAVELYAAAVPSGNVGGGNSYWYALRWNRARTQFDVVHASDFLQSGVRRIVQARTNAVRTRDQRHRIVVGLTDGSLRVYDRATKKLLSTTEGVCRERGGLQAFTAADTDGDGADELLSVCGDQTLFVEDERGGRWSLAGIGGTEIVVGQMDKDPGPEIATTSGRVIDVASRTVQWSHTQAFGIHLQVADVDGDGRDELVSSEAWYWVWAFDVERQLPKWSIRTERDIGGILMADVDGDGVQDLLVGDNQWGQIHVYNPLTQQPKGSIANPGHGVTQIALADVGGDGRQKVIWAAGPSSAGAKLYVADWTQRLIIWQSINFVGPFLGPLVGDLDGDGVAEVVVVSSKSDNGYGSGRILVFDSQTWTLKAVSPGVAGGSSNWTGVHDVKLRDIDGDGRPEILIAGDWLYDGLIEAYRYNGGSTFERVWTNATRPRAAPFYSVEVADVDGDGRPDILGGVGWEHSGQQGYFVYAYDRISGAEKWHTLQLGGTVNSLLLGDFDGNGILDFAAGVENGPVYIFNAPGHGLDAIVNLQSTSLTRLPVGAVPRLIVGTASGRASVRAFDGGVSYPEVASLQLGNQRIAGITLTSAGNWWVGSAGQLRRYAGSVNDFTSANYGTAYSTGLGAVTAWAPQNPTWVLVAGAYGVHRFDIKP